MSANLRAFLALIRKCEGTDGPDGYRTIVGGSLFDSLADHPRIRKSGTFSTGVSWESDAAGAYQFLSRTWARCKQALGLPDFSPDSQDRAAIWLIEQRGALADVEAGDLRAALLKCNREWASLPGSPYGQPTKTYEACERIFLAAGGILASQPAGALPPSPSAASSPPTAPAPAAPEPSIGEQIMAIPALVAAAGQALLPLVIDLFRKRGTATSERNADILEAVTPALPELVKIAQEIAPASNAQATAETILADKPLQEKFRAAVALKWSDLEPYLRFDEESREKARSFGDHMTGTGPQWRQIGFGALIAFLALLIIGGVGFTFYNILFDGGDKFSASTRDSIVQVLINLLVLVVGYFFGSSAGSKASGDAVRAIAEGRK